MSDEMILLQGTPGFPGIVEGRAWLSREKRVDVGRQRVREHEIESELLKFRKSLKKTGKQLEELKKLQKDDTVRQIREAQIQIVHDPEIRNRVTELIRNESNGAGYAVYRAFNEYVELLENAEQEWARNRSVDITSVRDSILNEINGNRHADSIPGEVIYFTDDLSPTEMIELHNAEIAAVVMQRGGVTSHSVILAQSFGIPCIIGTEWKGRGLRNDLPAYLDAERGEVVINPDEKVRSEFEERNRRYIESKREDAELVAMSNRTSCGTEFRLRANIEFLEELPRISQFGAEGVGLLRTEALFLKNGYYDSEDHFHFYTTFLEHLEGHPVIIRLLDIGGDKLPGNDIPESNPFLGWRGIRILLDETELLHRQLRTIFRAAAAYPGRVSILAPMISDLSEFDRLTEEIGIVRSALEREGVPISGPVPVGIMIEVPAMVLQAAEAARKADFFSIGSNDLTQYTMAADRGNSRVSSLYQNSHPAVWRLIRMACNAGMNAGIPVHVCGEIAGKPMLAAALIGLGIRELSMNPSSIPLVKKVLCRHSVTDFQQLTEDILNAADGNEAFAAIDKWNRNWSGS